MKAHFAGVMAATLTGVVAWAAEPAKSAGPAGEPVKLLHGFEIEEFLASGGKGNEVFAGKLWTGDPKKGPGSVGWRFTDHAEELKLPPGYDGPVGIYTRASSRDNLDTVLHPSNGVTQGKYSRAFSLSKSWWSRLKAVAVEGKTVDCQGAQPPPGSYTSVPEHFYQRECIVLSDEYKYGRGGRNWAGYDRLRFDILAPDAELVVGVRVMDGSGDELGFGRMGVRTALAVFNVPKGRQVTLDFPLAEMLAAAEMDPANIRGFTFRLNGYKGETDFYLDNVRLVKKEAAEADAKHPLIKMEGEIAPYARKVIYNPVERDAEKCRRKIGKVEKLVMTDRNLAGPYPHGLHFGGSGACYFNYRIRGCVAYDDDRLCFVYAGSGAKGGGGYFGAASFDGGKTWGGLKPGEAEPTRLASWPPRATISSDAGGDIYLVGIDNCSSYHEGYAVLFRRLAMTGPGWEEDRVSLADQNIRKCPSVCTAWRLPNGRIWLGWEDGTGKCAARYSDDDGYTWPPCKDASAKPPRPFYEAKLEDLKKPPKERPRPPENILVWPAPKVCGSILAPFGDGIAIFGGGREGTGTWQIHDGKSWGKIETSPVGGSVTVLGRDRVFRARGGTYLDTSPKYKPGPLVAADFSDGRWNKADLEQGDVGDVILTAAGSETVFCFYIKIVKEADGREINEIRYRKWKAGRWEDSTLIAREDFTVNHLAAPMVCPPNYAAVWWDERGEEGKKQPEGLRIHFAKIPNE
ncbi:MAG: hypothetical protein N3A38_02945 [Planctomycetota bacterium]|nr:hypothetical protein [Planctomycetota bacterium]